MDKDSASLLAWHAYNTRIISVGDSIQIGSTVYTIVATQTRTSSGFEAIAAVDANGNLGVAYAGTNDLNDIVTDLALLAKGWTTHQGSEAKNFYDQATRAAMASGAGICSVTLAGHSLGGALVEVVSEVTGLRGFAFNAPGLGGVIADLLTILGAPMRDVAPNVVHVDSEHPGVFVGINKLGIRGSGENITITNASGHSMVELLPTWYTQPETSRLREIQELNAEIAQIEREQELPVGSLGRIGFNGDMADPTNISLTEFSSIWPSSAVTTPG